MKKLRTLLTAAVGAICLSSASSGATFTGTLSPGGSVYELPAGGSGKMVVTVEFTRGVAGYLFARVLNTYNDYCGPNLDYCGGNDDEQFVQLNQVTDRKFVQRIETRGAYVYRAPGFVEYGNESLQGVQAAFDDDLTAPLGYAVSIAAIPEPVSWAMLIAGFGLAGAARRRRRVTGRIARATT